MDGINWYQVGPALVGGGAFGAVLKILWDSWTSRIQPVGYRLDVSPLFQRTEPRSPLKITVTLVHGEVIDEFGNLFLASLHLINKGNQNIPDFGFGITLNGHDRCVFVETEAPDRHRSISLTNAVSPTKPADRIDFIAKPFNRRDSYSVKFYIVIPEGSDKPGTIDLSTSYPIRFMKTPTMAEILSEATVQVLSQSLSSITLTYRK